MPRAAQMRLLLLRCPAALGVSTASTTSSLTSAWSSSSSSWLSANATGGGTRHIATAAGGSHAVVVGAGMAGMAAARALSDHFDRVTIVERDAVVGGGVEQQQQQQHNAKAAPRKGVPQSRQPHVLLARGLRAMESFYPGLDARLRDAGAVPVNYAADLRMFNHGDWYCKVSRDEDLQGWSCSRPLLEKVTRETLLANFAHKIQFKDRTEVTNILMDANRRRVEGVRMKDADVNDADADETANMRDVGVDMLVDAGGRRSQVPKWLEEHGYEKPEEKVINSYIGYSTRVYDVPPDFGKDWKILMMRGVPPEGKRIGAIFPIENNQVQVGLFGYSKDHPPTSLPAWEKWASSLPDPALADFIAKHSSPDGGKVVEYKRTENYRRMYGELKRMPDGLVVMGDAACSFNPVYGQGMTVGVLSAQLLAEMLAEEAEKGGASHFLDGFSLKFQKRLGKLQELPWALSTGEDLRYPMTTGGSGVPLSMRLLNKYFLALMNLCQHQPEYTRVLSRMMHMIDPPSTIFRPDIAAGVVKHMILGGGGRSKANNNNNNNNNNNKTNPTQQQTTA